MSDSKDVLTNGQEDLCMKVGVIALNAVPVVGGVLSGIANEVIVNRQNRRLNQFLLNLAEDSQRIHGRINKDIVTKEEFEDLCEDILLKAAQARQKEKLDAYRSIFIKTITSEHPKYDEATEIAQLIEKWQPRHIVLLKILSNPSAADEMRGKVVGGGGGIMTSISQIIRTLLPDWDDEQITRTWQELYDARIHNTPGVNTMLTDKGIHQLENRLMQYGLKVVEYLSEVGNN
jgi:hypothetical protein